MDLGIWQGPSHGDGHGYDDEQVDVQEPDAMSAALEFDGRLKTHWKSPKLDAKEYSSVTVVNWIME